VGRPAKYASDVERREAKRRRMAIARSDSEYAERERERDRARYSSRQRDQLPAELRAVYSRASRDSQIHRKYPTHAALAAGYWAGELSLRPHGR
jgi:hypothetical protein